MVNILPLYLQLKLGYRIQHNTTQHNIRLHPSRVGGGLTGGI